MQRIRRYLRPCAGAALAAYLTAVPLAQAGMVGTDAVLPDAIDRSALTAALARDDVRAKLVAHGVDPEQAMLRVQALSDADIARLSERFDDEPAGGAIVEVLLIIFAVWAVANATDWGKELFKDPEAEGQPAQ